MDKVIIYNEDNNRLSIISPTNFSNLTIEQIASKDVPNGKTYKIINKSELSNLDTTLRNAWSLNSNNEIEINLTLAKDFWKDKIRQARTLALKELDIDFIKAQEQGNDTTQIVADKNTLRDLPSQVDTATTVDEIKAIWNDKLGSKE
jgi:hypothetical protein